jgi:tetratricopeptide (TPR) repeat protein
MTVHPPIAKTSHSRGLEVITLLAFFLALAIVTARCTILESVREPFAVSPGTAAYPRGAGAATSLALDLFCCVPALMVLLRRAVDKFYVIHHSVSRGLGMALTAWLVLSIRWADDKFLAEISAADFAAAMVLLWTGSQLVRSWMRVRIVAAFVFGLLLVMLACGFYYKFVELPDLIHTFEQNKTEILRQRGIEPGSFGARQFEGKILAGEMLGFYASANSFAAMIVLTMMVGIGAIIQRWSDRDSRAWIATMIVPLPFAVWLLVCTHSKAGMVTPVLGLIMLWMIHRWRGALATRPRRIFHGAMMAVVCFLGAVIVFGLVRGGLPSSSLNFRWRYWTASVRMFERHPVRGVGWANFGPHYLRDRLGTAAEEIRDPHNFIVRFFVELGAVGGILLLAWMIRLWREMTYPITPPPPSPKDMKGNPRAAVAIFCATAALSILIATMAGLDFTQNISFNIVELMKRCLYLCALAIGSLLVGLRSLEDPRLDDRPAPWILYGLLVSLGLFLIHNLIEFSLFEAGPLCLFGFLCGTALGARQPSLPGKRPRMGAAVMLAGAGAAWVAAWIFVWLPVAQAETLAQVGDDSMREGRLDEAATMYQEALEHVPWNADYAFRAGRAIQIELDLLLSSPKRVTIPEALRIQIRSLYTTAISRDPSDIAPYLGRAELALQVLDADQVVGDFNRALELDPNNVTVRLNYASALEAMRLPQQELEQLRLALFYDDLLDPTEPKRLTKGEVEQIKAKIALLQE